MAKGEYSSEPFDEDTYHRQLVWEEFLERAVDAGNKAIEWFELEDLTDRLVSESELEEIYNEHWRTTGDVIVAASNPKSWKSTTSKMTTEYITPKQTKLLLGSTKAAPDTEITAKALAGLLAAGWPDPLPEHIASAIFMGCSYVMNLGKIAFDAGTLTPEENAAIQGVTELAMQIWKNIYDQVS